MDRFDAAMNGDVDALLAGVHRDNVNDADTRGLVALHWASYYGHTQCVQVLLNCHADMEARSVSGWTPLHCSVQKGQVDVVRTLLDNGAVLDTLDIPYRASSLHRAISNNHHNVTFLLLDRGARVDDILVDRELPVIPNWVHVMVASRSQCRNIAITIVGIHKYRHTTVTQSHDSNILRMICKHIWSTRANEVWK
jgi:ankyrin repeat protein